MVQAFAPQTLPVQDLEVLGDVNQHTHGTEFYGTSSNFVLLSQFFTFAQQHLPPGNTNSSGRNESSYLSPASLSGNEPSAFTSENGPWSSRHPSGSDQTSFPQGRVSIINLLSNEEALSPPSRPKTPLRTEDNQQNGLGVTSAAQGRARGVNFRESPQHRRPMVIPQGSERGHAPSHLPMLDNLATSNRPSPGSSIRIAERRLEREFVRIFMNNLHHLHPMLDSTVFTARCEDEIWDAQVPQERTQSFKHFYALYNIVVGTGALIAGSDTAQAFGRDIKLCMKQFAPSQNSTKPVSSQALSKMYFRKSRELLGDVFEVCSLESAQTLLLMVNIYHKAILDSY